MGSEHALSRFLLPILQKPNRIYFSLSMLEKNRLCQYCKKKKKFTFET